MKRLVPKWVRITLGLALSAAACDYGTDSSGSNNYGGGYGSSGGAQYGNTGQISQGTGAVQAGGDASTADGFDVQSSSAGYLTDADGQPLYFFANDLPNTQTSACAGECANSWPVFDAKDPSLGPGLAVADFDRFVREDGSWQTTFKGRPLYLFANDAPASAPAGDGAGGRWYVARDYFVFMASNPEVAPRNSDAAGTPYFTNKGGRTLYIFESDTPGADGQNPVSACTDACLDSWPAWVGPDDLSALIWPNGIAGEDFERFQRPDGSWQLTYKGWPLYFFASDDEPGEVAGHARDNWTAINADSFAASSSGFAPGY